MQLTALVKIPQTYKNLQRLREILAVVATYGFGDMVARLDLESALARGRRVLRLRQPEPEAIQATTEERIRRAFEELGPTFVKLGQILATRPDLIPMSLVTELRKLQDDVPPFAPEAARAAVEAALGRPVEEVFARFDREPLAAASIAQVHRARLPGGEEVVVKVRRPGIEALLHTDLDILRGLAALLEERVPEVRDYRPSAIVEEFARSVAREVDLTHEAANMARFARLFAGNPHVHVPAVHPELSRVDVLTMEYIDGIKASDLAALDAAGLDRKKLAEVGVRFCLEQIFEHGFFHGDPHPGNLFVLPGHVIAPIDMGLMGSLDRETLDDLLELLVGILMRDVDKIIRLFFRLRLIDERVDVPALRRDAGELIDRYYSVPLAQVDVGAFMAQLFEVFQRHHVLVPSDLLLIGKAMATVDGLARELYPELDPIEAIRPYVLKTYLQRLADPRFVARDWIAVVRDYAHLAASLPGDLQTVLRDLRSGRLKIGVRDEGLERRVLEQARSSNRLSMSVMVGAALLGSAVLLAAQGGPLLLGVELNTVLGFLGLGIAGTGYAIVAYGFWRSGRF